jgi:O-acetyl-ADP-ribose deacetylase (regulator of RNase III)
MKIHITEGDLINQPVEAIVNAWNCNIFPWWLLLPQGVSGAIKRHAGTQPFRELARHGAIALGEAVLTSAGRLPFRGIIHVAGINMFWRSSEYSVRQSVRSAMRIATEQQFRSLAVPLIGAGSGGGSPERIQAFITEELSAISFGGEIYVVRYATSESPRRDGSRSERLLSRLGKCSTLGTTPPGRR